MKGINPLERHFEKLILALVALGLLAWVGADLMGVTAETVKMGGKQVTLDEIGGTLGDRAKKLGENQRSTESPVKFDAVPAGEGIKSVQSKYAAPVAGTDTLPNSSPALASKLFKQQQGGQNTWYHQPTFGPVVMVSPIAQSEGAVAADLAKTDPKLAKALEARPGWSKTDRNVIWTTPTATLNLKAIREELARAEATANPPKEAIPASWRNSGLYLVDVVFERQQMQSDGSWGAAQIVEPLPGQPTFRGQTITSPGKVFEAMRADKAMQTKILQPTFFKLERGNASETTKPAAVAGESKEVTDKRTALDKKQKELADKEEALTKAGGEYYDKDKPDDTSKKKGKKGDKGDSGTVGGGGGPGGGGGGSGIGGRPPGDGESDPNSPKAITKRKRLTGERDKLRDDAARITKELSALTGTKVSTDKPADAAAASGVNVDDTMNVWAHDIGVQPGATYRYRCSVAVLNPFLGRKRQLVEAQQPLDAQFQILTQASEWSEVAVNAPYAFYAVDAYPPDGIGSLGSAQLEVFRLIDGVWRSHKFAIEPGDAIGRQVKLDEGAGDANFDAGWYVVAVMDDLAAQSRDARSKPTLVVVARRDGQTIEIRSPQADQSSEQRRKLQDRVRAERDAKPAGAAGSDGAAAGS